GWALVRALHRSPDSLDRKTLGTPSFTPLLAGPDTKLARCSPGVHLVAHLLLHPKHPSAAPQTRDPARGGQSHEPSPDRALACLLGGKTGPCRATRPPTRRRPHPAATATPRRSLAPPPVIRLRHLRPTGQVSEPAVVQLMSQRHRSRRARTVLGHNHIGLTSARIVTLRRVRPVQQHHDVRVLLQRTRLPQIRQHGPLVMPLLRATVELAHRD